MIVHFAVAIAPTLFDFIAIRTAFSESLDDSGAAPAETDGYAVAHRSAQVKGTCKRRGVCGHATTQLGAIRDEATCKPSCLYCSDAASVAVARFDSVPSHTPSGGVIERDMKQTRRFPLEATPRTRGV